MNIDRRQFITAAAGVILSAASTPAVAEVAASEETVSTGPEDGLQPTPSVVDAGVLSSFPTNGVYDAFREKGFFVIRRADVVFALSSICTHKGCKVRPREDGSFLCKCHKSEFDADGRVIKGPAPRDLPRLAIKLEKDEHVLVDPDRHIERQV